MSRSNVDDVKDILPAASFLTVQQIESAIMSASCLTDNLIASCWHTFTDCCLLQIETYLAAHFCAVTENTLSKTTEKDSCTDASVTYGFKFGEGIKGTPFGQMANTLSQGCLAEMDKRPVALCSIGTH